EGFRRLLERAREVARRETADGAITSAVLLLAVFEHCAELRVIFGSRGISEVQLRQQLFPVEAVERLVLEPGELLWGAEGSAVGAVIAGVKPERGLLRVLDAGLNRAREGLRVLEDYGRFVCDDGAVATGLKQLRHELCEAEGRVAGLRPGSAERLLSRDTAGDVGAGVTLASEQQRGDGGGLLVANLRRVQESLRSLEEFGKLLDSEFAGAMKRLRYRSYILEQQLCGVANVGLSTEGVKRRERLRDANLYVLITESQCRNSWQETVRMVLEGGADIVQLREKALGDAELLRRAIWVRRECESAGALFVMNDRPDLAVLSGAAGVHVGQEELGAEACRRIVTSESLVGLSTHGISQFQSAGLSGADYAGVGPVFPSTTKQFVEFPGLAYVSAAAAVCAGERAFPWFAIGGISEGNLAEVLRAGASRIAVGAAVTSAGDPGHAVVRLRS
ncbi:MAG: thiamine phosphate synthase, partial [Planctomycetaceae bacterium]